MLHTISDSLDAVQRYVEARGFRGFDPGDGLTSYLRPLTFGNLFAERLLQQAIWKSPVNIRPLVGVKPLDSTKGRGFMAWGYLLRHRLDRSQAHLSRALENLDWLSRHREASEPEYCWGNHFDFTTRSGRMCAHTPTIVWSGLIGQAFLEAYELTADDRWLKIADSICHWVCRLPKENTSSGTCLSYTALFQNSVHNSNLLGAGLLARTGKHTGNAAYMKLAREAVTYSCTRQRPDGAWWYGEAPKYHWIDNFHTGYNLDSLKRYIEATGDADFRPQLERGYAYFKRIFIEASGRPRYYHNRIYPIDIQCAAQSIDTLVLFADSDPNALPLAMNVANWTIQHMQDRVGYFHYRKYPLITARTPYFHWGQATMFKALAHFQLRRSEQPPRFAQPDEIAETFSDK